MTVYRSVADGIKRAATHPAGAAIAGLAAGDVAYKALDAAYYLWFPLSRTGFVPDMDMFMDNIAEPATAVTAGLATAAGLVWAGCRRRGREREDVIGKYDSGLDPVHISASTGVSEKRVRRILGRAGEDGLLQRNYDG